MEVRLRSWGRLGRVEWPLLCGAVSPDGKLGAFGGYSLCIRAIDLATGRTQVSLVGHRGWARVLAWSPTGKHLASGGDDGGLRIWDTESWQLVAEQPTAGPLYCLAWDPNGEQLVVGGKSGEATVWTKEEHLTGKVLPLRVRRGELIAATFRNGLILGLRWDGEVSRWIAADEGEWTEARGDRRIPKSQEGCVTMAAWSADMLVAGCSEAGRLCLLPLSGSKASLRYLPGFRRRVSGLCWSPDGSLIAAGMENGVIRIWNACRGEVVETATIPEAVTGVIWMSQGRDVLAITDQGSVWRWSVSVLSEKQEDNGKE